jgi:hypothetical protein
MAGNNPGLTPKPDADGSTHSMQGGDDGVDGE